MSTWWSEPWHLLAVWGTFLSLWDPSVAHAALVVFSRPRTANISPAGARIKTLSQQT